MPNKLSKKELKDIIQWDVKNWKNALSHWEAHFDIKPGMKVLALGEREGGLSLFFAKKGCEVVCSDYNEMPDATRKMHQQYGVDQNITYAKVDMRTINFPDETFDIVVFKSVIGSLGNKPDQEKAIAEIHRVVKTGGAFLFAENTSASKLHQYLRKKFINWSAGWRYIPDVEFIEWGKKFSKLFLKKSGFLAVFGRSEKQRSVLAGFDKASKFITPKSWRYICFGVFIK